MNSSFRLHPSSLDLNRRLFRQIDMKFRAFANFRFRPQLRPEQIGGLSRNRKSEPRSRLSVRFAAGEGLKHLRELLRLNARPLIDNRNSSALRGTLTVRSDQNLHDAVLTVFD